MTARLAAPAAAFTPAPVRERRSWLDLGRVIAMFAVIGIHYASPDFNTIVLPDSSDWLLGAFWMSFLKGEASTLFFMISGALLLPKAASADPKRTLGRVADLLCPLIVWSLLILGWNTMRTGAPFNPARLFVEPAFYHLWFLYAMIGVYAFLPVIKVVYDKIVSDNTFKAYFLAMSLAVFALNSYGGERSIPVFGLDGFFGYGMLFLLGGVTGNLIETLWSGENKRRRVRNVSLALFAVLKLVTFALLFEENIRVFEATEHWVRNFQLHIVLTSMVFLVFLSTVRITSPKAVKSLAWLSNKIFVIYFLHALILPLVRDAVPLPEAAGIPVHTLINFALCLAFAVLVRCTIPTRRVLG